MKYVNIVIWFKLPGIQEQIRVSKLEKKNRSDTNFYCNLKNFIAAIENPKIR